MSIESIVKVMNFHSLLRVNKAKKTAESFVEYEKEITNFADNILNNRNLILDKKMLKLDPKKKPLNIYIANDLGFCGNFNSVVQKRIIKDENADKIIIGKKIMKNRKNILLAMTKEEYKDRTKEIEDILYDSINNLKHGSINIIYNHYYNMSRIELMERTLLPLDAKKLGQNSYKEDFVVEGDLNNILLNIIVLYLSYEIRIAEENSYAAENVMRQMLTKQSLDKIKEIDEENLRLQRKMNKNKAFKRTLENYTNKKLLEE